MTGYDRDGRAIVTITTPIDGPDALSRDGDRLVIAGGADGSRWSPTASLTVHMFGA